MFNKYDPKTRKRIFSLLSRVIDNNVKLGIDEPTKITDNFIKEIKKTKLETWQSLESYCNSTYFYNECQRYVRSKVPIYKDRYRTTPDKIKATDEQVDYLVSLMKKTINHKNYTVRVAGSRELKQMLKTFSKAYVSDKIDTFKNFLNTI